MWIGCVNLSFFWADRSHSGSHHFSRHSLSNDYCKHFLYFGSVETCIANLRETVKPRSLRSSVLIKLHCGKWIIRIPFR